MKKPNLAFYRVSKISPEKRELKRSVERLEPVAVESNYSSDLVRQTQSLDACLDSLWRRCT